MKRMQVKNIEKLYTKKNMQMKDEKFYSEVDENKHQIQKCAEKFCLFCFPKSE